MKTYTNEDIIAALRERIAKAPMIQSQGWVAADLGVSPQYLSDVLNGHREPGPSIYEPLGFEKLPPAYRKRAP